MSIFFYRLFDKRLLLFALKTKKRYQKFSDIANAYKMAK